MIITLVSYLLLFFANSAFSENDPSSIALSATKFEHGFAYNLLNESYIKFGKMTYANSAISEYAKKIEIDLDSVMKSNLKESFKIVYSSELQALLYDIYIPEKDSTPINQAVKKLAGNNIKALVFPFFKHDRLIYSAFSYDSILDSVKVKSFVVPFEIQQCKKLKSEYANLKKCINAELRYPLDSTRALLNKNY